MSIYLPEASGVLIFRTPIPLRPVAARFEADLRDEVHRLPRGRRRASRFRADEGIFQIRGCAFVAQMRSRHLPLARMGPGLGFCPHCWVRFVRHYIQRWLPTGEARGAVPNPIRTVAGLLPLRALWVARAKGRTPGFHWAKWWAGQGSTRLARKTKKPRGTALFGPHSTTEVIEILRT